MHESKDKPIIQPINMTMKILECLANSGGEKGVTEIARELSATKPRIHRHLQTLRQLGYVTHSGSTRKYRVGMRLHLLAKMVGEDVQLTPAIRPAMEMLRDQTNQTSVFASLLDGKMTIIDFAMGTTLVQYSFRPGATFSLHTSSLGHISLAFGPEEYWNFLNDDNFEPETPNSITKLGNLEPLVQKARAQGWAIVPEGAVVGVNAIAAPVFYHDGNYAGSIAIVGSVEHIPADPPLELVNHVMAAARQASRNLGWRPEIEANA